MPDDRGGRSVGVSDIPKTIKGYQWFEEVAGKGISIDGLSLLGNNKGNTRYAAVVVCKDRADAKDFARRVMDKKQAPRAKLMDSDADVERFRKDMLETKGWSKDAPDGDKAITASSGVDVRGDATGFKHGFNPNRRSSRSPSRSRSRRHSASPPRKRRSPPKKRSPSRRRSRSRKRPRSPSRRRSPPRKRSPSRKQDASRKRDPSRKRDASRKRDPSKKRDASRKRESSGKRDKHDASQKAARSTAPKRDEEHAPTPRGEVRGARGKSRSRSASRSRSRS
mmetsp:Transcript_48491/g.123023  ORF Transcript_48491/g.123023 Transcript_48491/m.123023 type:complete len:280 (-) Transcript_48491:84-923(-)